MQRALRLRERNVAVKLGRKMNSWSLVIPYTLVVQRRHRRFGCQWQVCGWRVTLAASEKRSDSPWLTDLAGRLGWAGSSAIVAVTRRDASPTPSLTTQTSSPLRHGQFLLIVGFGRQEALIDVSEVFTTTRLTAGLACRLLFAWL